MQYGRIAHVDLKVPPRPPGYAFVEVCLSLIVKIYLCVWYFVFRPPKMCVLQFEDARDAEEAIRGRDGYDFDGHRLRVGHFFMVCLGFSCFLW